MAGPAFFLSLPRKRMFTLRKVLAVVRHTVIRVNGLQA